jgi:hypothetical protein
MPAPDNVLNGDELLVAVSDAMVGSHQRYHNRRPVTAKTLLLGEELLAWCSPASTATSKRR